MKRTMKKPMDKLALDNRPQSIDHPEPHIRNTNFRRPPPPHIRKREHSNPRNAKDWKIRPPFPYNYVDEEK